MPTFHPRVFLVFTDKSNAVLVWALHGYVVPTTNIVNKNITEKKSITKITIKDAQ